VSVQFGTKITSPVPGSAQGLYLIVPDVEVAHKELVARGIEVSEVFHAGTPGAQFQPDSTGGRISGPAPDHASYRSFATFRDPDGLVKKTSGNVGGGIRPEFAPQPGRDRCPGALVFQCVRQY